MVLAGANLTHRGAMSIPAGLYFGRNEKRPQREYPAPALKPFYTQHTNSKKCAGFSNSKFPAPDKVVGKRQLKTKKP